MEFRVCGRCRAVGLASQVLTQRLLSSSFLRLIFRILQRNPNKELLKGLWVVPPLHGLAASD